MRIDVLVHTTIDPPAPWSEALIRSMAARGVAVVPTLKLWRWEMERANASAAAREAGIDGAAGQLRAFTAAGGRVIFGTDVGYMADADSTDEYTLMARAGMTPMQILSSLTTAPAARWGEADRRGRIEPGLDADLVVLDRDPAADVRGFAAVRCTIRGGRELFVAR